MYGRVRTGQVRSVALPEPGESALTQLIERKTPIIGISFVIRTYFELSETANLSSGGMATCRAYSRPPQAPCWVKSVLPDACLFPCLVCILAAREFN